MMTTYVYLRDHSTSPVITFVALGQQSTYVFTTTDGVLNEFHRVEHCKHTLHNTQLIGTPCCDVTKHE